MGLSGTDVMPITQGSDVSYWLRLSKQEPSPDDDEDEPEADSSARDIAAMEPVFPAVSEENTVGDPNKSKPRHHSTRRMTATWVGHSLTWTYVSVF
jgi:hypothetical protein